jgi:5-methyltetrahydropteroyltriglutamate--homocysteine methyltransferase
MTKWFDTNYHYIVPEFQPQTDFRLAATKPFDEFKEALALGVRTKPVLIGPLTYLYLGKSMDSTFERLGLLERLLPIYAEVLRRLEAGSSGTTRRAHPGLRAWFGLAAAFLPAYRTLRPPRQIKLMRRILVSCEKIFRLPRACRWMFCISI